MYCCVWVYFLLIYPLGMDRVHHLFEILKNQYTLTKGIPNKIVKLKNYTLFKTLDICKKYMYPKSNNMF